jgi:hypothetical protein
MAISDVTTYHSQGRDYNKLGREEGLSKVEKWQRDGEAGAQAIEETAENMAFLKVLCATSPWKANVLGCVCTSRTTAVKAAACGTTSLAC